ncbi:helix-turn-helix domain-containing protein [Brevundimonas denitrificans]|nr:helix-turn-helix domain-containing protein [Brevundimonas denitrificans]
MLSLSSARLAALDEFSTSPTLRHPQLRLQVRDEAPDNKGRHHARPRQILERHKKFPRLLTPRSRALTGGKISNGYLSQLENGEIARPSAVMLHRLAATYGVDYAVLMERAGFVSESETPANRAPTSVLGELTPDEEEQLLNFLGYLRSQKARK